MKSLLYLSVIAILFSSCQKHEFKSIVVSSQPYLQLKDGTVIHTHEVTWHKDKFREEFSVNGVPFSGDEVAFYSNGKNSYANVHDHFAKLISEGNVNVYKTQHLKMTRANKKNGYAGGPYMERNSVIFDHYYIRNMQRGNVALSKLTYKSLEPLIPGKAVAYNYLKHYKHERNATTITTLAGVGLFVGGYFILNNKKIKGHEGYGYGMMAGGLGMAAISISIKIPHSYKLYQIASAYNSW